MNFRTRCATVLVTVACALLAQSACRSGAAILTDQRTIPATFNGSLTTIGESVRRAGDRTGWDVRPVQPGRALAVFVKGRHIARTLVVYNDAQIEIHYLGSAYLWASGGIHPNYNVWVAAFGQAIVDDLSTGSVDSGSE